MAYVSSEAEDDWVDDMIEEDQEQIAATQAEGCEGMDMEVDPDNGECEHPRATPGGGASDNAWVAWGAGGALRVPSGGGDDDEGASTVTREETEEDVYNDPRNVNNLSRSFKVIDPVSAILLDENDGPIFAFMSKMDGPLLGLMAVKQIMMLMHITEGNIFQDQIFDTEQMVAKFGGPGQTLKKLVKRTKLPPNVHPYARNTQTYSQVLERAVTEMPHDVVYDFREEMSVMQYENRVIKVGEILVVPVHARYKEGGEPRRKSFWMVILKTRKNYDFVGHVMSIINGHKQDKVA